MKTPMIMVVEDEAIIAQDIAITLRGLGYGVPCIASNAGEAIRQIEKINPDLVLMDIVMPGEQDGIEAAQEIRNRFDIPTVYLTAYADEVTFKRAKVTEPYGYVLKPFDKRQLQTQIEMALYKHILEKKL
jgi:FOG: CheY-like receiver